ncbi:hypothetical protein V8C86DRAFT_2789187, partial [Haematococcus lacustris]
MTGTSQLPDPSTAISTSPLHHMDEYRMYTASTTNAATPGSHCGVRVTITAPRPVQARPRLMPLRLRGGVRCCCLPGSGSSAVLDDGQRGQEQGISSVHQHLTIPTEGTRQLLRTASLSPTPDSFTVPRLGWAKYYGTPSPLHRTPSHVPVVRPAWHGAESTWCMRSTVLAAAPHKACTAVLQMPQPTDRKPLHLTSSHISPASRGCSYTHAQQQPKCWLLHRMKPSCPPAVPGL